MLRLRTLPTFPHLAQCDLISKGTLVLLPPLFKVVLYISECSAISTKEAPCGSHLEGRRTFQGGLHNLCIIVGIGLTLTGERSFRSTIRSSLSPPRIKEGLKGNDQKPCLVIPGATLWTKSCLAPVASRHLQEEGKNTISGIPKSLPDLYTQFEGHRSIGGRGFTSVTWAARQPLRKRRSHRPSGSHQITTSLDFHTTNFWAIIYILPRISNLNIRFSSLNPGTILLIVLEREALPLHFTFLMGFLGGLLLILL